MHRLALALAFVVAATAPVRAQPAEEEPEVDRPKPPRPPPEPNREGEYTGAKPGVRPGENEGRPQKKPRPGILSWIGFEAKDGGATVWLQSASSLQVEQRMDGATLIVHLGGVRRLVRNLRRHVDTRFFDTSIARITAKPVSARRARKGRPAQKAGVEVRITFKNAKDAREGTLRTATEADGLNYGYLAFPPGVDFQGDGGTIDPNAID